MLTAEPERVEPVERGYEWDVPRKEEKCRRRESNLKRSSLQTSTLMESQAKVITAEENHVHHFDAPRLLFNVLHTRL